MEQQNKPASLEEVLNRYYSEREQVLNQLRAYEAQIAAAKVAEHQLTIARAEVARIEAQISGVNTAINQQRAIEEYEARQLALRAQETRRPDPPRGGANGMPPKLSLVPKPEEGIDEPPHNLTPPGEEKIA